MAKVKKIMIDRLVVANSWGEGDDHDDSLSESAKRWRANHEDKLFIASNCAHRLWIGSDTEFASFPPEGEKNIDLMSGKKAYAFMLRMLSGIDSPRMCETHVRSQFKDKWRTFQKYSPETAIALETVYGQMMTDSGCISDKILSGYRDLKHELAARDVSGQVKGDKVLIVGDINRHGHVAQYTERMIHVSENKQNGLRGFLTITHPDPDVLNQIKAAVDVLRGEKKVRTNIHYMDFEDIGRAVEENDRIYIDTKMGAFPEADAQLIEAWQNRVRQDNTMTHLRGDPMARGLSIEPWESAGLENYFAPEDIYLNMQDRRITNPLVLERAEKAITVFADLREAGKSPTRRVLEAKAPEIFSNLPAPQACCS